MPVYLDHNATTPVDPRVRDAMQPWLTDRYGNPSSRDHALGWDAEEAVAEARAVVAGLVQGQAGELIFTSGATEGLNTALRSFVGYRDWDRKRIITCATEHDAVLAPCRRLAELTGVEVQVLPVDGLGHVDLDRLEAVLGASDKATLVAIMAANNETGTLHPVRKIAEVVHAAGAVFLCDITQAVGKVAVNLHEEGIDLAAFSAHKVYGPKGVGALFVRGGVSQTRLEPLILGGGQEQGFRGETLNVPGIVGFGEACRIAQNGWQGEAERVGRLRDRLEQTLLAELPDTWVNGDRENCIPNTTNIGFAGIDARTLIRDMHDIAVSTRSACSSGSSGPSHVLKALGLSDDEAQACIRFSLGRFSTLDDVDYAVANIMASVHRLRAGGVSGR
ncbi:cysteine desulfurase family protein [Candidatus Methylocalor cossyra]|uniref:cysteine desulfurase n=1 Tax=Candidatus Methylocalor cossyra TaxID=3108543 RepID=A0ABM9NMT1_9GAMM